MIYERSQGRCAFGKEDKFTFEDEQVIKALRESGKLTEKEKLAIQRLYRTYQYMTD